MGGALQRIVRHIGLLGRRNEPQKIIPTALFLGKPAALGLTQPTGLVKVANLDEAVFRLSREQIPVVVCDREGPEDWRTMVRQLADTPCRPSVILLSAGNTTQVFEQVVTAGGYGVVRKPVPPGMLDHAIRSAVAYWRCRRALDQ
jgi:DNA-binding NarL/FixJ family response regulator